MGHIIDGVKLIKDKKKRKDVYRKVIPEFQDMDCDTLYECRGKDKAFDEVLDEFEPPEEEGEPFVVEGSRDRR